MLVGCPRPSLEPGGFVVRRLATEPLDLARYGTVGIGRSSLRHGGAGSKYEERRGGKASQMQRHPGQSCLRVTPY